jgi:hypothetical protein
MLAVHARGVCEQFTVDQCGALHRNESTFRLLSHRRGARCACRRWRNDMTNEERHKKPDQPATEKEGRQVQREHHKPDHGKDDREIANEKAKKPQMDRNS